MGLRPCTATGPVWWADDILQHKIPADWQLPLFGTFDSGQNSAQSFSKREYNTGGIMCVCLRKSTDIEQNSSQNRRKIEQKSSKFAAEWLSKRECNAGGDYVRFSAKIDANRVKIVPKPTRNRQKVVQKAIWEPPGAVSGQKYRF